MSSEEIVSLLIEARDAYYNSLVPIMNDEEFDALEDDLRSIEPDNPYFSKVGMQETAQSNPNEKQKIKHIIPMLSMQKAKTVEEVNNWIAKIKIVDLKFCIQPKIDGLSASCCYEKGKLLYVATRGDGLTGSNISHVAEFMKDIKPAIKFSNERIEIRGELYLPKNTEYNTEGRPLRNNCVGIINRKDNRDDLHYVRFAVYQISGMNQIFSEHDKILFLKNNGFNAVDSYKADTTEDINKYYNKYMNNLRSEWEYETDGLIITLDDNRLFSEVDNMWVVDHHHHYAIALKPPSERRTTKLLDIAWQISRQGNAVPVALFEPVIIGGAKIERATLNNFENVEKLNLHRGDSLIVERANDVIPFVRGKAADSTGNDLFANLVINDCPSCKTALVRSGVHLKCVNPDCPEKNIQQILYWVRESGVENVAEATIRLLYTKGLLKNIGSLYTIDENDLKNLEGFAEKKTANYLREIKNSRKMSVQDFIAKLGIPLVQKKSIAKLGIITLDDFINFSNTDYVIGKNIVEWKSDPDNMNLFKDLTAIMELFSEDTSSKDKVCMTGKGPKDRKSLISDIESSGYVFSETVTADVKILLTDDVLSKSSKIVKARKLGITIISYEDFFKN